MVGSFQCVEQINFWRGWFKVDKTTMIQRIWNRALTSYYNDDTYMLFTAMCFYAKQGAAVENIYLLYLSPDQGIADSAQDFIPETQVNIPETQVSITVVALCISSIPCLNTLQWPKQCTEN